MPIVTSFCNNNLPIDFRIHSNIFMITDHSKSILRIIYFLFCKILFKLPTNFRVYLRIILSLSRQHLKLIFGGVLGQNRV